jgi:DNA-binding response OmpR family regulator
MIAEHTGRPVLLDFGLARPVATSALTATQIVGSPPYMAPEQIVPVGDDDGITARTDVYALGCTAFELLTGRTPFVHRRDQPMFETLQGHLHKVPPKLSSLRPELAVLDPVLDRALAKSPAERFESARAFAEALDRASMQLRALGAAMPLVTQPVADAISLLPAGDAFRVLVVDDDPMFCAIAKRAVETALRGTPVELTTGSTGLRALTAALRSPPQMVILDYDMPGLNGIETLSELRALPGAAQAPVLVVSGTVGSVEQWRFSVLGVRDFLHKPVDMREFIDAIGRLARRARAAAAPTETLVEDGLPPERPTTRLPVEVFLALLAVGWADGHLDDEEGAAVLLAAEAERLDIAEMQRLHEGRAARVDLAELDLSTLTLEDRLYVYAVARLIATLDSTLTEREAGTLSVLRVALQLEPRQCAAMDAAVRELGSGAARGKPERFDFAGLRRVIASHVAAAR